MADEEPSSEPRADAPPPSAEPAVPAAVPESLPVPAEPAAVEPAAVEPAPKPVEPGAPETRRASSFCALFLAFLFAALGEGVIAAIAAYAHSPKIKVALIGLLFAAGLVGVAVLPALVWFGVLLDMSPVRRLGDGWKKGLGGPQASAAIAVVATMGAVGSAFAMAMRAGTQLVDNVSPPFLVAGSALAAIAALAVALLVAAVLAHAAGEGLLRLEKRLPFVARIPGLPMIVALLAVVTLWELDHTLSAAHAALPTAGVAGLAVALTREVSRSRFGRFFRSTGRGVAVMSVLWMVCLPTAAFVGSISTAAQGALVGSAPYVKLVLAYGERLVDADGDGYSPILTGKDCDDHDATVNPAAADTPANGIDENCSGADATVYEPPRAPKPERPPGLPQNLNILLVMVDALRPDHLGFAGYSRDTSPNLDKFRSKATWFKNSYSTAPRTRDAMASMLTGLYPSRLTITDAKGTHTLGSAHTTAPEILAQRGYDTVGYTITYVMKRFRNYQQGFRFWDAPWGEKDWSWEWTRAAPLTTDAGLKFLESHPAASDKPWLLFLHYRCTHDPYFKHEKDFGDTDPDKYDSALHHCDSQIGRLLDQVQTRADIDRTAIILFSDHGELFGEHGHKFHGETVSEPDVRTLMLAKVPGATIDTVETVVASADMAPTLIHLAGATIPPNLDGWSMLPLMFGEPNPAWRKRPVFMTSDLLRAKVRYRLSAVLDWPFKYVWDMRTGSRELFDVMADPGEQTPLDDAARSDALRATLESWLAVTRSTRAPPPATSSSVK